MVEYTIIVENDETEWQDAVGQRYHFPKRYLKFLKPGTRLIHYKGRLKNRAYAEGRLSAEPHYFGLSVAGTSRDDPESRKGDMYLDIENFQQFDVAVPFKIDNEPLEEIPPTRATNFWRDGVRPASEKIGERILGLAGMLEQFDGSQSVEQDALGELGAVRTEGERQRVYLSKIERDPALRKMAISIHGTRCFACDMSFGERYGATAKEFIHIHHKHPLSLTQGPTAVDARLDLAPLCPNCHAVVHLGQKLLSINEVRQLMGKQPVPYGD
jgi:predicted HNH restriction endonuclease